MSTSPGPRKDIPKPLLEEITLKSAALASSEPATAGPQWGAMHKLFLKAKVDPGALARLVAGRDLAGLAALVRQLRGEATEADTAPVVAAPTGPAIDEDTLRHAMRAFRNRLKLTRLDAESKLGVGPMSGGRKHHIDAIIAPREYPREVWEALADAGKLRRADGGFYGLAEEFE